MLDVLIRGGTLIDGSGAPGRRADVGKIDRGDQAMGLVAEAEGSAPLADGGRDKECLPEAGEVGQQQTAGDPAEVLSDEAQHGVRWVVSVGRGRGADSR